MYIEIYVSPFSGRTCSEFLAMLVNRRARFAFACATRRPSDLDVRLFGE